MAAEGFTKLIRFVDKCLISFVLICVLMFLNGGMGKIQEKQKEEQEPTRKLLAKKALTTPQMTK